MKTDNLKQYIEDLNQQYKTGSAREHAYRPALKVLMQSLLPKMVVTNEPAHVDCGAPEIIEWTMIYLNQFHKEAMERTMKKSAEFKKSPIVRSD